MIKAKATPQHVMQVQSGSKGVALLIHNLGARWGWMVNARPRPRYPRKGALVPVVEEGGGGLRAGLDGYGKEKTLAPTGVRSPDHPARGESLYLLRYPATNLWHNNNNNNNKISGACISIRCTFNI